MEITKKIQNNKNIIWSSNGSPVDINLNMLAFENNDKYVIAKNENAYNFQYL
jgi:hypothetical protein